MDRVPSKPAGRARALAAGAVIVEAVILLASPGLVLADASLPPDGVIDPGPIVDDGGLPIELVVGLAAVGLAAAVLALAWARRPQVRPLIGAVLRGLPLIVLGFGIVVVGVFFADWSGQHRVSWPAVAVGALVAVLGVLVTIRTAARGRASVDPGA